MNADELIDAWKRARTSQRPPAGMPAAVLARIKALETPASMASRRAQSLLHVGGSVSLSILGAAKVAGFLFLLCSWSG